jgi:hypothetical protein
LIVRATYAVPEGFRVVSMFLNVIKVLSLTGPESFAAERTMDRY